MQLHIDCTDYRFHFLYQWMMTLATVNDCSLLSGETLASAAEKTWTKAKNILI